jgi:multicomponent Na+:H+ antiporter subunit D
VLSSLLAVAYVWRFVEVAYFRPPPGPSTRREAPLALLVPAWLVIAASVWFGFDTSLTVGSATGAAEMLFGGRK